VGGGEGRRSRLPLMSGVHGDGTIEAAREGEADLSYCTSIGFSYHPGEPYDSSRAFSFWENLAVNFLYVV
jgi:hypothetical protein